MIVEYQILSLQTCNPLEGQGGSNEVLSVACDNIVKTGISVSCLTYFGRQEVSTGHRTWIGNG